MGKECNVLVIGAGVAGLTCADILSNKGESVTIYERDNRAGGFVNLIPERRIKKSFIQNMVEKIENQGVKIEYNKSVNLNNIDKLLEKFDHIIIAVGTQKARKFDFPAKNQMYALDFLNGDIAPHVVAVCGGGNVALDCAIEAHNRNCDVTVYYRRTRNDLRASKSEIEHAEKLGIKFQFNVTDFDVPCDLFVIAIGLEPDLPQSLIDLVNLPNSRVHLAGDANIGASNIALAIKNAREVANDIL